MVAAVAPSPAATAVRAERGVTLVEVLIALAILFAGLIAIIDTFSAGYLNVVAGGGQTTATAYARQQMERLQNQPFTAGPVNGSDNPDAETKRTWTIDQVAGTITPNRQAHITVTVTWRTGWHGYQTITVETIRGEWG